MLQVYTQDDLARLAGVTRLTVRRALSGGAGVGKLTRQRICELAKEVGYRPNSAAKATRSGRFNAVGLLASVNRHQGSLVEQMLHGVHQALAQRGMHLTLTIVPDDRLSDDERLPAILREQMVDGLLLNYTHKIPQHMGEIIAKHQIPAVWVNSKQPGDCVYPDDFGGGVSNTRRLIELGHRRILYADFSWGACQPGLAHYSHGDRRAGYEQAMREAGLPVRTLIPERYCGGRAALDLCRAVLAGDDRPTGVVAYGGVDTQAFVNATVVDNLELGRSLSLVTFFVEPGLAGWNLSGVVLPEERMGSLAVERLMERINDPARSLPPLAVRLEPYLGSSAGPVGV